MARSFNLPDLGEGIHEGEVVSVLVATGDEIKEGDPILEIETDKATVEIPSPYTGRVEEILVRPGDVVNVGDVLMTFGDGLAVKKEREEKPAQPAERPEMQVTPTKESRPIPASPATRRLARELRVDLQQVTPSGSSGLVTAEDVRAFAKEGQKVESVPEVTPAVPLEVPSSAVSTLTLPDFSKWGPVERIPLRSIRRATAKQMALAWSQIPHVSSQDEVDVTKLETLRRKHKADIEAKGGKLTMTVFALKAVAAALKAKPNFNATLDTEAGEIIIKHYYHIGVAVDTDNGLIVPVIRDVDRKSITEIAIELNELVQRTRSRKASLEEMQGGTFTVTNIGAAGGRGHFAPIINYPEVAIFGMAAARLKPVVVKSKSNGLNIVPRLMMPVVLTIDHRALDGGDSTRFLKRVVDALEDPEQLLLTIT
jgi:pyruvate dehydrogenase E2 component (dihydrolipoamide acetyltransferase)